MLLSLLVFATPLSPDQGFEIPSLAPNLTHVARVCEYPGTVRDRLPSMVPSGVAIGPQGDVAFIERPHYPNCGGKSFLVMAGRERRVRIELPAEASLYGDGQVGAATDVRIGSDGTVFVTVAVQFSGAYSGTRESVFALRGRRWMPVPKPNSLRIETETNNISIGGVRSRSSYVLNGDFSGRPSIDRRRLAAEPMAYAPFATFVKPGVPEKTSLGTAISGDDDRAAGVVTRYGELGVPTARIWLNGNPMDLGAGVAFAVDRNGDAVGDDRRSLSQSGHPVVWSHGRKIVVADAPGSMYAMHDGHIAGSMNGRGFVAGFNRRLARITNLTFQRSRGWSIHSIIGLLNDGSMLALARREKQMSPQLIILADRDREFPAKPIRRR